MVYVAPQGPDHIQDVGYTNTKDESSVEWIVDTIACQKNTVGDRVMLYSPQFYLKDCKWKLVLAFNVKTTDPLTYVIVFFEDGGEFDTDTTTQATVSGYIINSKHHEIRLGPKQCTFKGTVQYQHDGFRGVKTSLDNLLDNRLKVCINISDLIGMGPHLQAEIERRRPEGLKNMLNFLRNSAPDVPTIQVSGCMTGLLFAILAARRTSIPLRFLIDTLEVEPVNIRETTIASGINLNHKLHPDLKTAADAHAAAGGNPQGARHKGSSVMHDGKNGKAIALPMCIQEALKEAASYVTPLSMLGGASTLDSKEISQSALEWIRAHPEAERNSACYEIPSIDGDVASLIYLTDKPFRVGQLQRVDLVVGCSQSSLAAPNLINSHISSSQQLEESTQAEVLLVKLPSAACFMHEELFTLFTVSQNMFSLFQLDSEHFILLIKPVQQLSPELDTMDMDVEYELDEVNAAIKDVVFFGMDVYNFKRDVPSTVKKISVEYLAALAFAGPVGGVTQHKNSTKATLGMLAGPSVFFSQMLGKKQVAFNVRSSVQVADHLVHILQTHKGRIIENGFDLADFRNYNTAVGMLQDEQRQMFRSMYICEGWFQLQQDPEADLEAHNEALHASGSSISARDPHNDAASSVYLEYADDAERMYAQQFFARLDELYKSYRCTDPMCKEAAVYIPGLEHISKQLLQGMKKMVLSKVFRTRRDSARLLLQSNKRSVEQIMALGLVRNLTGDPLEKETERSVAWSDVDSEELGQD